jgi:hypothetical protein
VNRDPKAKIGNAPSGFDLTDTVITEIEGQLSVLLEAPSVEVSDLDFGDALSD